MTTGDHNTAFGWKAGDSHTTGYYSVIVGSQAGHAITTGYKNTCIGYLAGDSIITGYHNTCIGSGADTTSDASTNQFVLGNSSVTVLRCQQTSITALSDERDKTDIINIPLGLDFINKLRPVKFKWDTREGMAKDGSYEAGFIAQDLQKLENEEGVADWMNLVHDENPDRLEATPGSLLPVLVNAIKELSAEVEQLKNQLNN